MAVAKKPFKYSVGTSQFPISDIQKQVVEDIHKKFKTYNKQILAWYTGSGKTNVFLALCSKLIKANPDVKIGVSSYLHVNIKNQTSERAKLFLRSHSVLKASLFDYDEEESVFIFNPQTLYNRKPLPFKFDYLIIDEAHIGGGIKNAYLSAILEKHCSDDVKLLGVSATPWEILQEGVFEDAYIHRRGMDAGLNEDGRITDFCINAEHVDLKTTPNAFTRKGELSSQYIRKNFEVVQRMCVEKVKAITKRYPRELGNKCLIIVPPGNHCGIAKKVAKTLGAGANYLIGGHALGGKFIEKMNEKEIIDDFRSNPKKRFLVVVHKCQIGFDMPELTSTIDLTMSRNVGLLIQRWGRLARKQQGSSEKKHYFYVFDNSLNPEHVEWILGTSVEYAMCRWTVAKSNRQLMRKSTDIFDVSEGKQDFAVDFSHLMKLYQGLIPARHKTIVFSEHTPVAMGHWTKAALLAEAKKYKSRTELSVMNSYVYRMLNLYHKDELEKIHPIKTLHGKWNLKNTLQLAKKCKSQKEFRIRYTGAYDWMLRNNHTGDLAKVFPSMSHGSAHGLGGLPKWTVEKALATAKKYKNIKEFRSKENGAYQFLQKKKALPKLKKVLPGNTVGRPWVLKDAIALVKKYDNVTATQFRRKHVAAYRFLQKHPKTLKKLFKEEGYK